MNALRKRQLKILVALVCVLVVGWYLVLFGPLSGRPGAGPSQEVAADVEVGDITKEVSPEAQETEEKQAALDLRELQGLINQALAYLVGQPVAVSSEGRDPFSLAEQETQTNVVEEVEETETKPEPDLSFRLNAIMWDQKDPVAVINGRVVREGDEVGTGIRVARIEASKVTLTFHYWGKENALELLLEQR